MFAYPNLVFSRGALHILSVCVYIYSVDGGTSQWRVTVPPTINTRLEFVGGGHFGANRLCAYAIDTADGNTCAGILRCVDGCWYKGCNEKMQNGEPRTNELNASLRHNTFRKAGGWDREMATNDECEWVRTSITSGGQKLITFKLTLDNPPVLHFSDRTQRLVILIISSAGWAA